MTLSERIKQAEGWRSRPYPDPQHGWDVPTFGYGFTYLTPEEGEWILARRIGEYRAIAQAFADTAWDEMNGVRQDVLTEIAYNAGLGTFVGLRQAVRARDWARAAAEIRDSKAWRDHQAWGNPRWERMARAMETGDDAE